MKAEIHRIKNSSYIITEKQWKCVEIHLKDTIKKKGFRAIILLPKLAYDSFEQKYFAHKNKHDLDYKTCVAIGIVAWTAWTALDEIRDEKKFEHDSLAIFSTLRPMVDEMIHSLRLNKKLKNKLIGKIGMMECANSKMCSTTIRSPYILKSAAASVPLLALMMKMQVELKHIRLCQKYFYHFIGARQLSDDALDWPEDMKKGQHTLVTLWLEQAIGKGRSVREYRKAFDTTVSPRVARKILRHSRLSISHARKMTCFTSTEFLEELPRFYETMATNILKKYSSR